MKKIESRKLEWDKQSKVGSTNNINHKPGGGNVKVAILKRQYHEIGQNNNEFITFCVFALMVFNFWRSFPLCYE